MRPGPLVKEHSCDRSRTLPSRLGRDSLREDAGRLHASLRSLPFSVDGPVRVIDRGLVETMIHNLLPTRIEVGSWTYNQAGHDHPLHRARLTLGEPLRRELQRPRPRRTAKHRRVRHAARSPRTRRGLAHRVQHLPAPLVPRRSHPRRVRRALDHQPARTPMTTGPLNGAPSMLPSRSVLTSGSHTTKGSSGEARDRSNWRTPSPCTRHRAASSGKCSWYFRHEHAIATAEGHRTQQQQQQPPSARRLKRSQRLTRGQARPQQPTTAPRDLAAGDRVPPRFVIIGCG
jgi:hypothetical protein